MAGFVSTLLADTEDDALQQGSARACATFSARNL